MTAPKWGCLFLLNFVASSPPRLVSPPHAPQEGGTKTWGEEMRKGIEKRGLKWNICVDWNMEGNSTLGFLRQVHLKQRLHYHFFSHLSVWLCFITLSAQTAVCNENHLHLSWTQKGSIENLDRNHRKLSTGYARDSYLAHNPHKQRPLVKPHSHLPLALTFYRLDD